MDSFTTKSGREHKMIARTSIESEFQNEYGERFQLRFDPTRQTGELLGDETDWKPIEIRDDTVSADFIFGDDEWTWLSTTWQQFTGRPLQAPAYTRFREVMQQLRLAPGVPT